jgi:WD40 repeat protein
MLWDIRQDKPAFNIEAHSQDVNSVEFNPNNQYLILTASNDKTAALWDTRNLNIKINVFEQHTNDVMAARWNPNIMSLFATYSADRRVNIWDLGKIGSQISKVDSEDGPPELLVRSFVNISSLTEDILLKSQILIGILMTHFYVLLYLRIILSIFGKWRMIYTSLMMRIIT